MKGPGYKLSHDVRRTWRCPACGTERKLLGDVTSLRCHCRPEGTFMKIVAERTVAPRPLQIPNEHDIRSSEFGIEDLPVLQPNPSSLPPERTGPRRPRPGSDGVMRSADQAEPAEAPAKPAETAPPAAVTVVDQAALIPPPSTVAPAKNPSEPQSVDPDDEWGAGIL